MQISLFMSCGSELFLKSKCIKDFVYIHIIPINNLNKFYNFFYHYHFDTLFTVHLYLYSRCVDKNDSKEKKNFFGGGGGYNKIKTYDYKSKVGY